MSEEQIAYTANYDLAVIGDDQDSILFKDFRRCLMGTSDSNMTKIDAALQDKENVSNRVSSISKDSDRNAYPSVGALRDYVADAKSAFETKTVTILNISGVILNTVGYSEFTSVSSTVFESLVAYKKSWSLASEPNLSMSGKVNISLEENIYMEHGNAYKLLYIMHGSTVLLRLNSDGTVCINNAGKLGYSVGDTVTFCLTINFPQLRPAFIESGIAGEAVSPRITVKKIGSCATITASDIYGERSVEIYDGVSASPQFVSTLADCTDTEKPYVLPDGYIYAYLPVKTAAYTNLLPAACDIDGSAYGTDGCGYKSGYRINSSGYEVSASGMYLTGLIPFSVGQVLRMKNMTFYDANYIGIATYDSSKSFLGVTVFDNLSRGYEITQDTDSTVTVDTTSCINTNFELSSSTAYVRIMSNSVTDDSIITVDEEIAMTAGSTNAWQSTGHVYQSADYEPRVASLESRMATAEAQLGVDAASNISEEAERVANLITGDMTCDSFSFSLAGDTHFPYNAATTSAVLHTGLGISEIARRVPLDLCAYLGDYVLGNNTSTLSESKKALRFVRRALMGKAPGTPEIWLRGNCDMNPYCCDGAISPSELHAYIDSANRSCHTTAEGRKRGFGYIDFDDRRIRVIYLSTSDTADIAYQSNSGSFNVSAISAEQLIWLSYSALNLYGKSSPEKWGFIILSHAPLNWADTELTDADGVTRRMNVQNALTVLDSYTEGGAGQLTVNGTSVCYDFRGTVRGEIIALFHGHTHNFKVSHIGTAQFPSISIPQVCAGKYNEYTDNSEFGEFDSIGNPVYYYKTADTSEDTSFCIATVDRLSRRITVRRYGAGYDRTVTY